MIYLSEQDLLVESFGQYTKESTHDWGRVKDKIETRCIGIVKTYLRDRYPVDSIFDKEAPIINEVIIDILSALAFYKIISKNKAQKVPTDIADAYKEAVNMLEKLNSGRLTLDFNLPESEDNNSNEELLYGDLSNPDNYI